jgi:TolB protein
MARPTWIALLALLSACGGDLTAPPTPTLEVQVTTTGQPLDPDGYTVQVDGARDTALGVNATIRIEDLLPGNHEVVLDGVAPNCLLAGPNPRTVSVSAGDVTPVRFDVLCGSPPGSLEIVVTTTGDEPDPDGYLISLDGTPGVPVGGSGTVTITNVAAGEHAIRVDGLALNCVVAGGNPRLVTIESGPVHVDLEVHCSHPAGTIRVATTTSGARRDPDGYEVTVGGTTLHIDSNGTLTVPDLPLGDIEVRLDGIAPNCRVEGDNPRTVSLTNDAVVTVSWVLGCLPTGEGIILFSSNRSGTSHVYRVRQDGADLRDLTPTFEAAGGDWSPDGSRIVFTRATDLGPDLMVMDADGKHATRLGVGGARPRWSPDGRKIVFAGLDGLITVINADGSGATPLVAGANPDWSPDGTLIAFERVDRSRCVYDLFCSSNIYVMSADGTGERVVAPAANASDRLTQPDWSPDGSKIAYTRSCCFLVPGTSGVYTTSALGGPAHLVYRERPVQSGPIWSPDGSLLLVAVRRSSDVTGDLMVIAVDGSGGAPLAPASGSDFPQAWR